MLEFLRRGAARQPTTPLIITTSRSVLWWQPDRGCRALHQGAGLYYGIAFHNDRMYVAARNRMVSSGQPAAAEQGRILVFDRALQVVDTWVAPFALRDMHQIAWHGDELLVTCSFDNMVAVRDAAGHWRQWYPFGPSRDEPADINHFNTVISLRQDRIALVAHNLKQPSELLFFSWPQGELCERIELGCAAHDLWQENDEWFTCSSGEGAVVGSQGFRLQVGDFPRGVAVADERRYVGISTLAERYERDFTSGRVAIYDLAWKPLGELALPEEGLVLDICALPSEFL